MNIKTLLIGLFMPLISLGIQANDPPTHIVSKAMVKSTLEELDEFVDSSCRRKLRAYLNIEKGYKAFTYAIDDQGNVACRYADDGAGQGVVNEQALSRCVKTKAKKGLDGPCQVILEGQMITGSRDLFFDDPEPLEKTDTADIENELLAEEAFKILGRGCHKVFKVFLKRSDYKSFYYARDSYSKDACGFSGQELSNTIAENVALSECNKDRKRAGVTAQCRLFSYGPEILVDIDEYGIGISEEDFLANIDKGNTERIAFYLELGMDVNTATAEGVTSLLAAALSGDRDLYFEAISRGARTDIEYQGGTTLLMAAVKGKDVTIIRDVLRLTKDINQRNEAGISALYVAVGTLQNYVISVLLNSGANSSVLDPNEKPVLPIEFMGQKIGPDTFLEKYTISNAFKKNDIEGLEQFYTHDQDLTSQLDGSYINLESIRQDTLEWLLTHGMSANLRDSDGDPLLHLAIKTGDLHKVRMLLENGADKALTDSKGNTALQLPADYSIRAQLM
ncbi:ankyrin repeat domain-containing protein [Amphritea balenae]|uniref:Ankyrin repeat domain-containing protein n=1 Tax=Amphritea balenae TaxID=452629 RepID=A0A3P1SNH5_9GAMM|nr:ankyrin repeat domain-containing protein [Amphritea balenae]RRC98610.1 ankyrin repeat domain-containing protein [Amphritea balenae]GGK65916.1 hypothetical protein GCM10007941_15170 [Amphritea balenae]